MKHTRTSGWEDVPGEDLPYIYSSPHNIAPLRVRVTRRRAAVLLVVGLVLLALMIYPGS